MTKLSKALLKSLYFCIARAQTDSPNFVVTSCNDDSPVSFDAKNLKMRVFKGRAESKLSVQGLNFILGNE